MSYGKDEFPEDSVYGKKAGETYSEADQRKKDEYRKDREDLIQQQRDDANRSKGGTGSGQSSGGGGGGVEWVESGERTKIAEFLITLGRFSFGSGAILWIAHWMMPKMVGVELAQGLLGGGLACLAFVYFFKAFFYILLIAAVLILANAGSKSPDGFSISSIPIEAYLAALGMVAVAFILRAVISKRE